MHPLESPCCSISGHTISLFQKRASSRGCATRAQPAACDGGAGQAQQAHHGPVNSWRLRPSCNSLLRHRRSSVGADSNEHDCERRENRASGPPSAGVVYCLPRICWILEALGSAAQATSRRRRPGQRVLATPLVAPLAGGAHRPDSFCRYVHMVSGSGTLTPHPSTPRSDPSALPLEQAAWAWRPPMPLSARRRRCRPRLLRRCGGHRHMAERHGLRAVGIVTTCNAPTRSRRLCPRHNKLRAQPGAAPPGCWLALHTNSQELRRRWGSTQREASRGNKR